MSVFFPVSLSSKFNNSYHVLQRFFTIKSRVILVTNSMGRNLLVKLLGFQSKNLQHFMELGVFYVVHKSFPFSLPWGRLIESTLSRYVYLTYVWNLSSHIRLFFQMVPSLYVSSTQPSTYFFLYHACHYTLINAINIIVSPRWLWIFLWFYPELECLCTLHNLSCRFAHYSMQH